MSGRRTVTLEALSECYILGGEIIPPPDSWWIEPCTTMPTDSTPGAPWGAGRGRIRNVPSKFVGSRPRQNASGIWTPVTNVSVFVVAFELWDAKTDGTRHLWGRFYDPDTGDPICGFTVPAGYGIFLRTLNFRLFDD